jgi:hypothetical protein
MARVIPVPHRRRQAAKYAGAGDDGQVRTDWLRGTDAPLESDGLQLMKHSLEIEREGLGFHPAVPHPLGLPGMLQIVRRLGQPRRRAWRIASFSVTRATQLFTTMISAAFFEGDIDRILDAGVAAPAPKSVIRQIVADVLEWRKRHPADWRATRRLVKDK